MKKFFAVILSLVLIISVFSGCTKTNYTFSNSSTDTDDSSYVKAVTFNCAAPWGNVLKGTGSSARVKRFAGYMSAVHPDIIGTQEMNSKWMDAISEVMNSYDSYGVKRGGDDSEKKSEMNSIFWLKDKYECLEKNTFWLSETPDKESRYDGAGCNRVCTYAILKNRSTGKTILFLNTHLDNASDEARAFGAQIILDKIDDIISASDTAVNGIILSGDFNDTYNSSPYNLITQKLNDSSEENSDSTSVKSTYHDWGNLEDSKQPIDFIFSNMQSDNYQILDDTSHGYISDHYGVYSEFLLP